MRVFDLCAEWWQAVPRGVFGASFFQLETDKSCCAYNNNDVFLNTSSLRHNQPPEASTQAVDKRYYSAKTFLALLLLFTYSLHFFY